MTALASTFPWEALLRSFRSSFSISVFEDKVIQTSHGVGVTGTYCDF
jgi:hypothetical protein